MNFKMNTMIMRKPSAITAFTKELSPEQREELLRALKARFEKNMNRHKDLEWAKIQATLEANTEKLWSLNEMERTGGEPDVVGHDTKTSSWVKTPPDIRNLGGALFADRRYGNVFVYHNSAPSWYSARAFRGSLRGQI